MLIGAGGSPDVPCAKTEGAIADEGGGGLGGDEPAETIGVIEKMPCTGTHRADKGGEHRP